MTLKTTLEPLEELALAPASMPWDAETAAKRLKDALGWAALALYSLWVDTSKEPESFEAYPLLVVDIVDGEPCIVPRALETARAALAELDAQVRAQVEQRIAALEERPAKTGQASKESVTEATPQTETEPGVKADESERIKAAEEVVDRLARGGKLLHAWGRDALIRFIAGLSDAKTIPSDGFEPISPREFFSRLLESLPALVPLDEFASPHSPVDNSFESLGHKIARALYPKKEIR